MAYQTPEESRQAVRQAAEDRRIQQEIEEKRLAAAETKRKEDREEELLGKTHRSNRSNALIGVIGLILAAIITGVCSVWAALGKKAEPNANVFKILYAGAQISYKLVDSNYSLEDALPKKPTPIIEPHPASPAPVAFPTAPTPSVTAGSCTGLSEQRWAISAGRVSTVADSKGYVVTLNLKNITTEVMQLSLRYGQLTDDQGHVMTLATSSINRPGAPFTTVDPGVALPANFRFNGETVKDAKTISFTVNLIVSLDNGKSSLENTLGCTDLAVHE